MDDAKHWKPEPIMELLAGLFAGMFAGAILIAGLPKLIGPGLPAQSPDLRFLNHIVGAATFHGLLLWLAFRFVRSQETSWRSAFGIGHASWLWILQCAVVAVAIALPCAMALGELSSLIMTQSNLEPESQQAVKTLQQTRNAFERSFFGFSAILLAPVAEEILFRGILYPALRALGFPRLAFWGTAVLFAAIHANLVTFLSLTVFALILTELYNRTRDLRAPILAHCLFNAVNFVWILRSTP